MTERFSDWQDRLLTYISSAVHTPFQEGEHDCALFLAGAVAAMTGVDYAAPYRGRYTTTKGGLRHLRKDGFHDHVALAAHHLAEKPPAFAMPGDGAVVETEDGPALGVVQGESIYLLTPAGLGLVPLTRACRAFGV